MANVRYSGGRSATLGTKTIDENGVYNASSDELDGYSEVTVDVPQPSGAISLTYNANGTYSDVDVENYETANIQVDVPVPAVQTQQKEVFAQTNHVTVLPDSGKYLSKVIVQPQRNLNTYTPVADTSNNDMGIINNYRYVNTQGMITPTGTKEVEYTTNGTHTEDIKNYENIDIEVNVPVTGDLGSKTIIANGTYQALDDNLDGYDEVTVNVPQNATLGVKNITANGDYYASADSLDGYSRVSVAVPGGGSTLQANKTVTATTSQQIVQPDQGYDGLEQVTVNPQEHTATYTPAVDTAANDMGVNNNYRYVNTSNMFICNNITPRNNPPTYFNSGEHLTPTANGYAITNYSGITPNNFSPAIINSDTVYVPNTSGYAIKTYSDETPSDSNPPAISSGSIIKATASGYLYATQQGGGQVATGTFTGSTSTTTTVSIGFQPKYLMVMNLNSSNIGGINVYDEDALGSTNILTATTAVYVTKRSLPSTTLNTIASISSTGFTYNKVSSGYTTCYYFAIG